MGLTAAANGFIVFLLTMPAIQGQNKWAVTYPSTQICALMGSTVEIHCTYRYPSTIKTIEKKFWFTAKSWNGVVDLGMVPGYRDRVEYICDDRDCTLRIQDLRESDSAVYKFRFITDQPGGGYTGEPGVTLFVTDPHLEVHVTKAVEYQDFTEAELKCHHRCPLADKYSYIWYKNGQKICEETSYSGNIYPADSYSCALKGHEDFHSPPVCVHGQSCNRVAYIPRSICAFKGSSVSISSMYNSHEAITFKFWFSSQFSHRWQNHEQPEDLTEDTQYAGRVQIHETMGQYSTLRMTDLRASDSAQYHFKFATPSFEWRSSLPGTTLTVTDPDVRVQVKRTPYASRFELTCHSSCQPGYSSYMWFKNGQRLHGYMSKSYSVYNSGDSFSCAIVGQENFPSPPVCVIGQTCNSVTYISRSICATKGSSANISCTYNSHRGHIKTKFWFSPDLRHQWQTPSQPEDFTEDSQYEGRVQVFDTARGRSTLRMTDLRESDSAQYRFKFKTPSFEWRSSLPGTTLTVTALQVQVTRATVHPSYTEAELKCHSRCSATASVSYVWLKNEQEIIKEENPFYTDWFYPGDIISCALKGHETYRSPSVYVLKLASLSVSPSGEIMEGSSVTLTCSSDANSAAKYTWYKNNVNLKPLSKEPQLAFTSIQSSDSGVYYCAAENKLSRRTSKYIFINVKYAPKTSSVSVSPSSEVLEGSSVTLTCSSDANPAANYTWYKENQTLSQGPEGIYRFTSISSEDRGTYYCKSENQHGQLGSKSVFIDVQYAPKLPSVSMSPSSEVLEGSSVNLTCSSDANPAANYTWYKENEHSPEASGQIFTIAAFRPEHSGNYYCEAQNRRGSRNSTLHVLIGAGRRKSRAAGAITAVILAVILLSVFMMIRRFTSHPRGFFSSNNWWGSLRKTKVTKKSSEPRERPDNVEQPDDQDELHYASICFSENHTEPVYCNVRPAVPCRHKEKEEEEEEEVNYDVVKFNRRRIAD